MAPTSVPTWPVWAKRCPALGQSNAGCGWRGWLLPHEVDRRAAIDRGPRIRTTSGKWTPASTWPCVAARPVGCESPTNAAARSCRPRFSPLGSWPEVPAAEVQEALRKAFAHWGLPGRIRVDNGTPWGATGGLPTALAMWLVGLCVGVIWNPPRQPRKNAVVERSQGVGQSWLEPGTCASADELQQRADDSDTIQRGEYLAFGHRTRLEEFPGLSHSGRRYSRRGETRQWDLRQVLDWLSGHTVPRRVSKDGKVSVYDRNLWVGRRWVDQQVWVGLDPEERMWLIMGSNGAVLNRSEATELKPERIRALAVSRIRGKN